MYSALLEKIKGARTIAIFRHKQPDGDAIFSQSALQSFLQDNFPDKEVRVCGADVCDLLDNREIVSDEFIAGALGIALDCANLERLDDSRILTAPYIIKIDHHPNIAPYGQLQIVKEEASATCEVLAEIFFSKPFADLLISKRTAEYLLCGILTDTLAFSTSNTSSKTLAMAAELVSIGDLKMAELQHRLFDMSYDLFKKRAALANLLEIKGAVGFVILSAEDLDGLGMSLREAKNSVASFGKIRELKAWAIFVYNREKGSYEASLRSVREYPINAIAEAYGGGGHKNAAGIKDLSLEACKEIIDKLQLLTCGF